MFSQGTIDRIAKIEAKRIRVKHEDHANICSLCDALLEALRDTLFLAKGNPPKDKTSTYLAMIDRATAAIKAIEWED